MKVKTITRDEYRAKTRHDYAGPASQRLPETVASWRKTYPDWAGKHWAMWNQGGSTTLGPVNVEG